MADLEYAHPEWPRRLHAAPWLQIPAGAPGRRAGELQGVAAVGFGAVNLHTTATAIASSSRAHHEDGPVRALLGPRLHAELLASQVTDFDEVFGTRITWTLGFVRDRERSRKAGSAARPPGGRGGTTTPAPT